MKRIESYEQIQSFVQYIRNQRNGFVTNFYWDSNKHPYWIADGRFEYEQFETCIFLVHKQESFSTLFFISSGYKPIVEIIHSIQLEKPVIVDLVCKGKGDTELALFKSMGFDMYQSLYRMVHVGKMIHDNWNIDSRVQFGKENDVKLVYDALQENFDPLAEQLPSFKEVTDFALRNQILIIKDNAKLCGFLIFEILGMSWYLRYWYTSQEYRNQGIGAALLRASLIYGKETKRQILWVIDRNDNAIKRYEHYGFTRENMNDYVMIKK